MENGRQSAEIYRGDCVKWLRKRAPGEIHLSFVDPPFNQGKDYRHFDDKQDDAQFWGWMEDALSALRIATASGGAVYFMQREKNAERVLRALRESGWAFQNLIVWKKKTSAVPCRRKYGLQYQIIAYAINGDKARVFNRLKISPPLPPNYKFPREGGIYVTDVWDDIRELTAGYFAGDEALRTKDGERFHKQQSPLALLARIVLSSSLPGDLVCDPFAGTGTTLMAASQLNRRVVGAEIDPANIKRIKERLAVVRPADDIGGLFDGYRFTDGISDIWGVARTENPIAGFPKERHRLFA